jgi:hypothetical protein
MLQELICRIGVKGKRRDQWAIIGSPSGTTFWDCCGLGKKEQGFILARSWEKRHNR